MKKQTFLILALFISLFCNVNALPVPGNETTTNTATSIVLSNEEGRMIDQLIAAGYGNISLYKTLFLLQESSGGVISDAFLDILGVCPAGSPIFTKKLKDCKGISGGVAINTDGRVFTTNIKGRSYFGQTGYSTHPPGQFGMGRELFTYANSPEYYINAESGGKTYKVFAVGWSSNQVPTFMLFNEEGGLIDKLIADGHGDESLYEVLQILQPISGGAILADYMAALAAAPADCEAKTAELSIFSSIYNNPIGIGANGDLILAQIHGRDYYGDVGFSTTTGNIAGVGTVLFTSADCEDDFIDAGTNPDFGVTYYYKAFAIGLMSADAITVSGTAMDDTAILWIDNKTPSVRDKTWDINVTTGTVKAGVSASDVTLTGLPAGLNYTATKGTGNNIVFTLTGAATTALTGDATITAVIKGSAVTETDAQDSEGIALQLWYISKGTTIVLTNEEGAFIDKLAGHGANSLYEVLELLQPDFSGVITERFMKTLASNSTGSEIFTAALSNYTGINNPIGINANGTLSIVPIYGRDHYGKTGYTTTESNMAGVGTVWVTAADSTAYYIDAGLSIDAWSSVIDTTHYYAFAIGWMPDLTSVSDLIKSDNIIIYPNPTKGMVWFDLQNPEPIIKVTVYDMKGKQVFCTDNVKENHIDLSGLESGVYLLELETHNKKLKQKVIKK